MALPTNTFTTYTAVGNREDLSDMIYRIDPTDTPFMTAIDKAKASAVNHEWQTQALAAANTANAQLEGDDAAVDATTPTVRLGNVCQISRKVPQVSGTQQAKNTGTSSVARVTASVLSWVKSNTSKGASGADPSAADGTGTRTDGTQRVFSETQLKTVLQTIWNNG